MCTLACCNTVPPIDFKSFVSVRLSLSLHFDRLLRAINHVKKTKMIGRPASLGDIGCFLTNNKTLLGSLPSRCL